MVCEATVLQHARLVDWMTSLLADFVKQIVVQHRLRANGGGKLVIPKRPDGATNLEEVTEAIELPVFDQYTATDATRARAMKKDEVLPEPVMNDLRDFVRIIASKYNDNPFHNFEHAW